MLLKVIVTVVRFSLAVAFYMVLYVSSTTAFMHFYPTHSPLWKQIGYTAAYTMFGWVGGVWAGEVLGGIV